MDIRLYVEPRLAGGLGSDTPAARWGRALAAAFRHDDMDNESRDRKVRGVRVHRDLDGLYVMRHEFPLALPTSLDASFVTQVVLSADLDLTTRDPGVFESAGVRAVLTAGPGDHGREYELVVTGDTLENARALWRDILAEPVEEPEGEPAEPQDTVTDQAEVCRKERWDM